MQAHARNALIIALLSPGIGAAQTLPCGECYDRLPQQQPPSAYELLPGGDDPRTPGSITVPYSVGTRITPGVRSLILIDGRRAVTAPVPQPCTGNVLGSLTETFGGVEWRITGCADDANDGAEVVQLRFEEAQRSGPTPRHFLYVKSPGGAYRLAEVGPRERQTADAAFDALSALTPAELGALEQRLRDGVRSE